MTITVGNLSTQQQAGLTSVLFRSPSTVEAGELIIWGVVNKYPTAAPDTPTGFAQLAQGSGGAGDPGADSGNVYCTIFTKVADGSEDDATESIAITGGNTAVSRSVAFTRSAGTGWLNAAVWCPQNTGSNSWSCVGDSTIDLAAGDVVLVFIAKNGDNDTSLTNQALTATGITFGTWNSLVVHGGTTGGQDCAYGLGYFNVTAGSGTQTPTFTMDLSGSANLEAGGVMLVRMREDGAGPTPITFSGTIPTLTGSQGVAFSEDLSSYFTGSETPFSYALLTGTLPAGLSLNTSTCVISGTPTVGGTHAGLSIRGTDTTPDTDDSNTFQISLSSNPSVDVGYYGVAQTTTQTLEHTTVSHSFHHDGTWWTFMRTGSDWNLYEESGNVPASPGDTVDWVGTPHLSAVHASVQCTVCVDGANNTAYVLGFGGGATTQVFRVLTYAAGDWTVALSFNLTGSAGVALGDATTFSNNSKLSIGIDSNGVPMVVAGNRGVGASAANGCHIAWPDDAGDLDGTWTSATIDAGSITEGDASGRFAGVLSQGGTDYVVVCFTDDSVDEVKIGYHAVETTLANYSTGWTVTVVDASVSVDNHCWGGVMSRGGGDVVVTIIKDGDGASAGVLHVFTSTFNGTSWTHKHHHATNGIGDAGDLAEAPSRPVGVLDETNDNVYIFYHAVDSYPYGWVGYKMAAMADLLAATTETEVWDISVAENSEPVIYDASLDSVANAKSPAHPVTSAMGYFPITAHVTSSSSVGDSIWWAPLFLVVSHPATGVLAAGSAAVSGSSAHLTLHTSSGAIAAQAAVVDGTSAHLTLHTSTGVLAAQAATVAGSAVHPHIAAGSVAAQAALLDGSSTHGALHTSTGVLAAQESSVAGASIHPHIASGAMTAQASVIDGVSSHLTLHGTAGVLAAQGSVVDGTATHGVGFSATGVLAAQSAVVAGSAVRLALHTSSGVLASQPGVMAGSAVHPHISAGSLVAGSSAVVGEAGNMVPHDAAGELASQSASVSGASSHLTLHASTGTLVAGQSSVSGSSELDAGGVFDAVASLSAQAASVVGSAMRLAMHVSTGSLSSGQASVNGTSAHLGIHATSGSLSAGYAEVFSSSTHDNGVVYASIPAGAVGIVANSRPAQESTRRRVN